MSTNIPRKEERSVPIVHNSNVNSKSSNHEEEESSQASSSVVDIQRNFGNTQVQSSLQGHSSGLDILIHGALGLEVAGMSSGEGIMSHIGNSGIQRLINRKRLSGGSDGEVLPDASNPLIQRIRTSGGSPLPDGLRNRLEGEFQHRFDHVRIHASGSDASSAEALHAEAFTVENHIFFNTGKFNPQNKKGMELLAHELTHVLQHDEGRLNSSSGEMNVSSPTDSVEIEAVRRGAEVAQSVGTFHPHNVSSSIEAAEAMFDEPMPTAIGEHLHTRMESSQETSLQKGVSEDALVAREQQVEAKSSESLSVSVEVTFPIYAPFVTGTVKVELNQSNSSSTSGTEQTEVEGVIEGTINISLLFITLKFGIELKGKVTVQGNVDPMTAIQKGCKELVAYKMAQDFLPKITAAKKEIEESYVARTNSAVNYLTEMLNSIQNGEWKDVGKDSAWYNPFDSPIQNLKQEVDGLSSDIRSIANGLGEGEVTSNELFNLSVIEKGVQKVAEATSKEDAITRYYEFVTLVGDEWANSRQRVLGQVDQIQCVKNDPSVGFEGSVSFKASGEVGINNDNKVELGVSRVVKVEDKVGDEQFNHDTKTATEVFGKVSLAGGRAIGLKCTFAPDWSAPKNLDFEATIQLGEITTEAKQPSSNHASAFIQGINVSGGSLLQSALDTAKSIGKQIGDGVVAQKDSYFSAESVKSRAGGGAVFKASLTVVPKLSFRVAGGSLSFAGGSCAVKFERSLEVGAAFGKTAGVGVKGTIKKGVSVEVGIQRKEQGTEKTTDIHGAAARGVSSNGGTLPYAQKIQESFGRHDISGVRSHQGGKAAQAASSIGAKAYATGNDIAFGSSPDIHTAAHEAAHVIQQQGGVSLKGGIGEAGDKYERHADSVADLVVQGKSAESLLDQFSGNSSSNTGVQRKESSVQRDEAQSEESSQGLDVQTGVGASLSGEVTFPIHAPFVTGTVKFTLNQAQTDSIRDGQRTEVEGSIEATININLLFVTLRFGIELRGKVVVQGSVSSGEAIRRGCKELTAYHMAQDFLPRLAQAKREVEVAYLMRKRSVEVQLDNLLQLIEAGNWQQTADESAWYNPFDSPFENLMDEFDYLADEIRSIANNLGEGQVTASELINVGQVRESVRNLAEASSKPDALARYRELFTLVTEEWFDSQRRIDSQIDQIQCVQNDPSVGFEGSVTFKASGEMGITGESSVGLGVARVVKMEDQIGATAFDHSTSTATEVFGSFPFPMTDGVEAKCSFEPDYESASKVELELSIKFGEVSTEPQPPSSSHLSSFVQALRGGGSNLSLLGSPRATVERFSNQVSTGLKEAKDSFFDRGAVAERAQGSNLVRAKFTLVPKLKLAKTGSSWGVEGGSIALKYEQTNQIGSAFGNDSQLSVSGTISSGFFISASI